ncbi:hypothetical protein AVEN_113724-1 [Araneus ventricosus]|uniref:Reverse transcriptase domain-containing protein n=1 Tax=Araneus ventricosus TaxID=182803 RepID=A0A4Y2HWX7_ARAVE|nr:hypothetical protein AVEN_113724-1 [Araneus ventricosus]
MAIYLDIQGAFDHMQYSSIRNSLYEIKFSSHTTETLKDTLNDRKVTIQTSQGPVTSISEEWQPNIHLQAFANDFIFVITKPTGAEPKTTVQAALTKFQH